MNERLYRGKRKDNGEFVEGYYAEAPISSLGAIIFVSDGSIVCEDTAPTIIKVFSKQHSNYSQGTPLEVVECEQYEVAPDTVGQYSCVSDMSGKRVFEGDILEYNNKKGFLMFGVVKFGEYSNDISRIGTHMGFYVDWEDPSYIRKALIYWLTTGARVVGNIYDNPELVRE